MRFILTSTALCAVVLSAQAASHREAPMIPGLAKIDVTDTYAFISYEPNRSGMVTLMTNFVALQDSEPNAFKLDPGARYHIHIDNSGDGREDLRFELQFKLTPRVHPKAAANAPAQNVQQMRETYTLTLHKGSGEGIALTQVGNHNASFDKPADYLSRGSQPDYPAYAAKHRYNINLPGCAKPGRVFVGQRQESLHLDLSEAANLLRQAAPPAAPASKTNAEGVSGKQKDQQNDRQNVITWAFEIPVACLISPNEPVIGVWSTVSQLPPAVAGKRAATASYNQIARMGMPWVNEVIIGAADIDKYPSSAPKDDAANGFVKYFNLVTPYSVAKPPASPRADMEAAFLQGIPNLNQFKNTGTKAEMLRLNTAIAATPREQQNPLGSSGCFNKGVFTTTPACDPAGFPNGRRPGDDVGNIVLQIAKGGVLSANPASVNYRAAPKVTAKQLDNSFPYLQNPLPDKGD